MAQIKQGLQEIGLTMMTVTSLLNIALNNKDPGSFMRSLGDGDHTISPFIYKLLKPSTMAYKALMKLKIYNFMIADKKASHIPFLFKTTTNQFVTITIDSTLYDHRFNLITALALAFIEYNEKLKSGEWEGENSVVMTNELQSMLRTVKMNATGLSEIDKMAILKDIQENQAPGAPPVVFPGLGSPSEVPVPTE